VEGVTGGTHTRKFWSVQTTGNGDRRDHTKMFRWVLLTRRGRRSMMTRV
jgi:hypothetical protein